MIIQGFKSFKDRTTIHFDNGITGIVGPNGCGKSNIVDALFWVMGEQSAKHLRGNSMKDVIFSGSSKYTPAHWAEVSLILGNDSGKHIHVGNKVTNPVEIQLTRKLYRNGETEYRINGIPCRLKDIQEVFMDTGAGAKSYSIIAQGEINRLVQAKPIERRSMIEEVAGITKFKMRKKESLKKIEQTQTNLHRLNDLQVEIDKNLKSLQRQAEKAEKARSLKEKIKNSELTTNSPKAFDILRNIRDGENIITEKNMELESWTLDKDQLELSLADERIQKDEKLIKIEELQLEYNELSKNLAAAEERLNYLEKTQQDKIQNKQDKETEIKETLEQLENRKERLSSLDIEFMDLIKIQEEDHDFSMLEQLVDTLKEKTDELNEKKIKLSEDFITAQNKLTDLDQQLFKNTSKQNEISSNLEDSSKEMEALELQYSGVSTDISAERQEVTESEAEFINLANLEATQKQELQSIELEHSELEQNTSEKHKQLVTFESQYNSLKELADALEGVNEGAADFIKEIKNDSFKILGNIIKCSEKYTIPVQNILKDYLEAVISTDPSSKEIIYNWMASNSEKNIDFIDDIKALPYSNETIERLKIKYNCNVTAIEQIIDLPESLAHLKNIFSGLFIIDEFDINNFDLLNSDINFNAIVSLDGKIVIKNEQNIKRLSSVGNSDNTQSILSRNNKLEKLNIDLQQTKTEYTTYSDRLRESKNHLALLKSTYDKIRSDFADAKAKFSAKKSALDAKLSGLETSKVRIDILKNRTTQLSLERLNLLEEQEKLVLNINDLKEVVSDKNIDLKTTTEDYSSTKDKYESNKSSLFEKQVEINSLEKRIESLKSQIEDIKTQIGHHEYRLKTNQEHKEVFEKEIVELSSEHEKLKVNNSNQANELSEKNSILSDFKDHLNELVEEMNDREIKVKKLTNNITKNEKEIMEFKIKLGQYLTDEAQVVRDTFEKYQIDLRDILGIYLDFSANDLELLTDNSSIFIRETEQGSETIISLPYEFNRKYGQELKDIENKLKKYKNEYSYLGEINWQAIEYYEKQKMRSTFLKEQETELKSSLLDLQNAIEHIDTKSKERFKLAFEEVNSRFEKVFPIIFGGGKAELKVLGDANDPECGIDIIAQPPGKKMHNINAMSGGEKAMTAVSLIFSIFLVKPSPFCLLDEVDAPLDDANVGRFNELLREMSSESQFILITHNKKTMEMNDTLYGVTMQEAGVSKAVSVQLN